jgi:hypothetical protein
MARSSAFASLPYLLATFVLAGCLPSSCKRVEPRALFPADSLSRVLAEATPVDTLDLMWETTGPEALPFEYPRTVLFDAAGVLHVSDAEANAVHAFDAQGQPLYQAQDNDFPIPFLAGAAGDTVAVFSPSAHAVRLLIGQRLIATIPTPSDLPRTQLLQYAAFGPGGLYVKILGEAYDNFIGRLDASGAIEARWPLEGPIWRFSGKIVVTGDTLLSACGYRPVLDLIRPLSARDTLALAGFDSPMLARSRSFVLGDLYDPPLLTPSMAVTGDRIFVLNIRPGWLLIDVYNLAGRLQRRLVQQAPVFAQSFYPIDLAAHPAGNGFDIAVVYLEPQPRLALYRWEGAE